MMEPLASRHTHPAVRDTKGSSMSRVHRFCDNPECAMPYYPISGRQRYCGAACSQRVRTVRYRTEKRVQWQACRRAQYARRGRGSISNGRRRKESLNGDYGGSVTGGVSDGD